MYTLPVLTPDQIKTAITQEILKYKGYMILESRLKIQVWYKDNFRVVIDQTDDLMIYSYKIRSTQFDRITKRLRD
jgi:hypothetical protein